MLTLEANYKIITPLFMSGADQNGPAELRPPSFKGVLRFWYRAIAPTYFNNDFQKVRNSERELFGSINSKAKFSLRIDHQIKPQNIIQAGIIFREKGVSYLGYGVNNRFYIEEGQNFCVKLTILPTVSEDEINLLKKSLIALGLFGGMGSRSRKGLGSVNLISLFENKEKVWQRAIDTTQLIEQISNLLSEMGSYTQSLPSYSCFSGHAKVFIVENGTKPIKLLDVIGKEMIRYRSYGSRRENEGTHKLPWGEGEASEQIFGDDHDLICAVAGGKDIATHPRRVIFGLPHNYRFSDGMKVDISPNDSTRRASPLFIRIHELKDSYVGIFTILPAEFLPNKERIQIKGKKFKRLVDVNVDYKVIDDFIKRFPQNQMVFPKYNLGGE